MSSFSSGVVLTEDERACCQRALSSLRRDALRSELIYINENPTVNLQHAEAAVEY